MHTRALMLGVVALIAAESPVGATPQVPDALIYEGKKQPLPANPLEQLFRSDKNQKRPPTEVVSSACWRGYRAEWKVQEGWLTLTALTECDGKSEIVLPGRKLPLRATWFSGVLRVPQGEQLRYDHAGDHSGYEKDLALSIVRGKLVQRRVIARRPRKETKPSRPRTQKELADGLSAARAHINESCYGNSKDRPRTVPLRLVITAEGLPRQIQILNKLSTEHAQCIRAAVLGSAKFTPSDAEERTRYWLKLR